jgi:hypothetical protein
LKDQIHKDLTVAMKARESLRVSTLRLLLSQIKNEEIERGKPLAREDVLAQVQRGIKTRRESVEQFERGGREDLATKERQEIAILEGYLPPQLGSEEIARTAEALVRELGAQGKKDMGRVMKAFMERYAGQVDGRAASAAVSALLK